MKICHFTSVHSWNDTRIFHKQCRTLASLGYEVHLIAPDRDDGIEDDVFIHRLELKMKKRFARILRSPFAMYKKAREINAEVYHFHDPELLITGLMLAWMGKHVIYDAHEDVPKQILYKHWLPAIVRRIVSFVYERIEHVIVKRLSAVVAATPTIAKRFEKIGCRVIVVKNYPILSQLTIGERQWNDKGNVACYIGSITKERGLYEMIEAMEKTRNVRLWIAGTFAYEEDRKRVEEMAGWRKVDDLGYLSQAEVKKVIGQARCGIVVLHPTSTYIDSLPVKMFEYMAGGIPVIASNFPLWKEIVEQNECGICVDPFDTQAIADAIQMFVQDEHIARKMGENGKMMVEEKYNWEQEAEKLIALYQSFHEGFGG